MSHSSPDIRVTAVRRGASREWMVKHDELPLDASPGSPWVLLPAPARAEFELLARRGIPLSRSVFGRPLLGVKTGCNEAFLVSGSESSHGVEPDLLRPVVRGEHVAPWSLVKCDARIVWTHDSSGRPLRSLPPGAARHLALRRSSLEKRSDSRAGNSWWKLFRTDGADASAPRVIWADFGRRPRAAVVPAGDTVVPLNTCYIVRCPSLDDAFGLAAILNSDVMACWLSAIAEPARGGYHRYLGWTMSLLPVPSDWPAARKVLSPLGARASEGELPGEREIRAAVLRCFGTDENRITALLDWGS